MGIIFILTEIFLILSFIFIRKTEEKIDIVNFSSLSIVLLFCYNTFICYILTFFTIPCKLWILSLINILITALLLIKILKNKKIQKFKFNKTDIVSITIIVIIVLIISYINFNIPFNVKYETSDPSVHYLTAVMFAENESLLAGAEGDYVYGSFNTRKTVSYVNSGLLMKCFVNNDDVIGYYNIFVAFGIITWLLTALVMFSTLTNYAKKKEHRIWALIISLICILGYPLNSFLFGFEYLSMGLLIICAILSLMYYYDKVKISISYFVIFTFLLNFGLFSAYYMFVPFIYPAMWIYFCITSYYKTKKIITKELIALLVITLLIPFILGFIYHLAPNIYAILINQKLDTSKVWDYSNYIAGDGLATNGYIYINLYSNMILLLPLVVYFLIKKALDKDLKNESFIGLLIIFAIFFIELLLIGMSYGKVSIYYLSKNYFALWIILLFCNYKALIELSEKGNYLPRLFIGVYVLLMIVCTIFSDVKMIDDALYNDEETIFSVMEIFGSNKTMLIKEEEKLNQDEIDILMYARENLDYNSEIEVVTRGIQYYWSYAFLRYINDETATKEYYGQHKMNWKSYLLGEKIGNVDYIIYFNRSKVYSLLEDRLFENAEIIYENEAGGILKYSK